MDVSYICSWVYFRIEYVFSVVNGEDVYRNLAMACGNVEDKEFV